MVDNKAALCYLYKEKTYGWRKSMEASQSVKNKTRDLCYISIFTALLAICSWLAIPTAVPFTLQTFAVFLAVGMLGGKRGACAIIVYILLGAVGVPVFQGFTGGPGILLGNTGGYIIGFLCSALAMWGMQRLLGERPWVLGLSMLAGLLICYAFGTLWFMAVYTQTTGAIAFGTVLGWCVAPFFLPDLLKIALAYMLTRRLGKAIRK